MAAATGLRSLTWMVSLDAVDVSVCLSSVVPWTPPSPWSFLGDSCFRPFFAAMHSSLCVFLVFALSHPVLQSLFKGLPVGHSQYVGEPVTSTRHHVRFWSTWVEVGRGERVVMRVTLVECALVYCDPRE